MVMDEELQAAVEALTEAHRAEVAARLALDPVQERYVAAKAAHDAAAAKFHRLIAELSGAVYEDSRTAAPVACASCGHLERAHRPIVVAELDAPIGWQCVGFTVQDGEELQCGCGQFVPAEVALRSVS